MDIGWWKQGYKIMCRVVEGAFVEIISHRLS